MVSASLLHEGLRPRFGEKTGAAVAFASLAVLFCGYYTTEGVGQVLLLGVVFYIVSSGNSLFGILRLKASRRLGEISYSVYLLHGLILTMVFSSTSVRNFALQSAGHHWLVIAVCAMLVLLISAASYLFIERPGIALGKRQATRFAKRKQVAHA
jgi:peptidoglycan/LPS O-acetylase OafA/YrhL